MLLEGNLSAQELIDAQNALEIFVNIVRREGVRDELLESLEDSYYDTFRNALYKV